MLHTLLGLMLLATTRTQDLPKGQFPEGWTVRADVAPAQPGQDAPPVSQRVSDLVFVVMKPGWHITTGPSVILYQSAQQATGAYTLKSSIFLFDPGTRQDAFGGCWAARTSRAVTSPTPTSRFGAPASS